MKKTISVCLAVLMLLSILPAFAAADSIKCKVQSQLGYVTVFQDPSTSAKAIAKCANGTVLNVDFANEVQNFMLVTLASNGISGWVDVSCLIPVNEQVEGEGFLRVEQLPKKVTYIQGEEEFDPEGLFLSFGSMPPTAVNNRYKIFVPNLNTLGEKTVYVVYCPVNSSIYYTASFKITVVRVPLKQLTVKTQPVKTQYIEGEALDLTGLTLEASYTDGRAPRVFTLDEILSNPDFTLVGCHNETQGSPLSDATHRLQFIYKYNDISCNVSVTVERKTLTDLTIKTYPDSTVIYSGDKTPSLKGLVLLAHYSNGLTEEITPDQCRVIYDSDNLVYGSGNTVEVKYASRFGTKSVMLNYTYAVAEVTGIKVKTPEVVTYILGEAIDLSAYSVFTTYSNGDEIATDNFTMSKIDYTMTGAQTVTVNSGIYSAIFTIYITPYYQKGDIDGNAVITAADARLALRHAVGLVELASKPFFAGDIDRDDKVTAADARLILRAAVGLEDFVTENIANNLKEN